MLGELEKLSLSLDTITQPDAERIIHVVNKIFINMLNPHIVDLIWKGEGKNGVILRPFITSYDTSRRGGAKPYQVAEGNRGIWTWVYHFRQPVWIESIKSQNLSTPVKNEATGEGIDSSYLNIFTDTDSIMTVPLVFRDVVWGVYSIELPISGKFTQEILELMERVAMPLAVIVWKADTFVLNQKQTSEAVRLVADAILDGGFQEIMTPYRSGFIARPFAPEFNNLEICIKSILEKRQILARHYVARPGAGIVIEDIMKQIKSSHFGVIDISGFNLNVMIELGMFMVLRKKFIVLQQKGDTTLLPFDIRPYHVTEYVAQEADICYWDPVDEQYEPIETLLHPFITDLFDDPNFVAAKPWRPAYH